MSCELMMSQVNLSKGAQDGVLDEYPPEWQADFNKLAATIIDLSNRYPDQLQIRIWDPRSLQGMIKSVRHWIRHYPTFIVNGQKKYAGWDTAQLEKHIQSSLESVNCAI